MASVDALAGALLSHMEHEEDEALPLVEACLGATGWAEFGRRMRKAQGLRGAATFFPWLLDDAPAATRRQVLGLLPPPARILYRTTWSSRKQTSLRTSTLRLIRRTLAARS